MSVAEAQVERPRRIAAALGGAQLFLRRVRLEPGPPLTMLALLVADRDALWGNFPPSPALRVVQRVGIVVVFALPGLLAWAAS